MKFRGRWNVLTWPGPANCSPKAETAQRKTDRFIFLFFFLKDRKRKLSGNSSDKLQSLLGGASFPQSGSKNIWAWVSLSLSLLLFVIFAFDFASIKSMKRFSSFSGGRWFSRPLAFWRKVIDLIAKIFAYEKHTLKNLIYSDQKSRNFEVIIRHC